MKIKICFFTGYFPLQQGGAEYQAYIIAESLDKKKFDVFFIMFSDKEENVIHKDDYTIYLIKFNRYLIKFGEPYFLYYYKIKKILSKENPDIIYRRMGYAILGLLAILKKKMNFHLIWACAHINDLKKLEIPRAKAALNFFDDLFRLYGIRRADKILVQTMDQKILLFKNFQKDSLLFPNLHPAPKNKIDKKEYPIQIIWIANYKKWKNPDIFVNMAEHFQGYPNVKFIMIGRLDNSRQALSLKKKMNLIKNFVYKGELTIDEVNAILSESHIFINTSLYEGFPNTFIQAWMRKVPVVSLHVDPDNMIKDNRIGFHSKTIDQLIKDTKTLIENKELRTEMSERAHTFSLKNFSVTNLGKISELFESCF